MKSWNHRAGFTLIEVIIAVALVAIMAVAITPPLVQNIKQGKLTRAQSDAQAIGTALLNCYKDMGEWPYESGRNRPLQVLAGNHIRGGGSNGIADGSDAISGSNGWRRARRVGSLTEHLIRNKDADGEPIYPVSQNPVKEPGWNGPYLNEVPLDPWGSPYMINIVYAEPAIEGSRTEDNSRHNVVVISAGANKVFETPFDEGSFEEEFGGDDIGFIVRPASG